MAAASSNTVNPAAVPATAAGEEEDNYVAAILAASQRYDEAEILANFERTGVMALMTKEEDEPTTPFTRGVLYLKTRLGYSLESENEFEVVGLPCPLEGPDMNRGTIARRARVCREILASLACEADEKATKTQLLGWLGSCEESAIQKLPDIQKARRARKIKGDLPRWGEVESSLAEFVRTPHFCPGNDSAPSRCVLLQTSNLQKNEEVTPTAIEDTRDMLKALIRSKDSATRAILAEKRDIVIMCPTNSNQASNITAGISEAIAKGWDWSFFISIPITYRYGLSQVWQMRDLFAHALITNASLKSIRREEIWMPHLLS